MPVQLTQAFAEVRRIVVATERVQLALSAGRFASGMFTEQEVLLVGQANLVLAGRGILDGERAELAENAIAMRPPGKQTPTPIKIALLLLVNAM
jgi:hypothetical protein